MKQIKLTKSELERLLNDYTSLIDPQVERLVEACKDLDHANDDELLAIYNAFCSYLGAGGLRVYRMNEFNSLEFESNLEQKRLTDNVDLDDQFFAMDLYGLIGGYKSFSDLHSYLQYRIPLRLRTINDMLEFTFEDEEGI
jgi:hypothetical protein